MTQSDSKFDTPGSAEPALPLLANTSPEIGAVLERALDGYEISEYDGLTLFGAEGRDLDALLATANVIRHRRSGSNVSFVVTRNINFTNVCYMGCRFCGFAKHREDKGAELLSLDEVATRAKEAEDRGATEVCIQGGLHPDIPGVLYRKIVQVIKAKVPSIHIHAFSPFEIWYGHKKRRMSAEAYLEDLKAQGLGTIPGTAAEILDTEVRKRLTRNKLSAEQWISIVKTAHRVGLRSTATIMYGHVDAPRHWAAHIALLRDIQKETGGFTEFVPLGFVHYDSPLYRGESDVRPGPTRDDNLRMHAVARIMLAGWIDNIQASWPKLGPEGAQQLLHAGANDMGGTLMNESITRAAGGRFGQEMTARELAQIIRATGRIPVQRDTSYRTLATYDTHDPVDVPPLVPRTTAQSPIRFLKKVSVTTESAR